MHSTQGTAALLGASADAAPHVEEHEHQAGQLRRHLPPRHRRLQPRRLPLAPRPRPHCQVVSWSWLSSGRMPPDPPNLERGCICVCV